MTLRSVFGALILAAICGSAAPPRDSGGVSISRKILALYDSRYDSDPDLTITHQAFEMPLNHLGFVVRHHDVNKGLPRLSEMADVAAVLTYFRDSAMADPLAYLDWACQVIDSGKRFVIMGQFGAVQDLANKPVPLEKINALLGRLGMRTEGDWARLTYDVEIVHKVPAMVEFERPLTGVLPPFSTIRVTDPRARSYLTIRRGKDPKTDSDMVVTGPAGGYAANRYALHYTGESDHRQWHVNPFEFFRIALDADAVPKPDVTTLSGRRIYYSHVDGDGWRNVTEVPAYRKQRTLSSEVVLREVVRAFPDLPVTVAPIAGDLDPGWHGTPETLRIARELLSLPQVEAGTHTFSHPLDWGYFANAPAAAAERTRASWWTSVRNVILPREAAVEGEGAWKNGYVRPRSYETEPFSVGLEVNRSVALINGLLPPGRKVQIVQWSGDTRPFAAAIAAARSLGLRNINGGNTKFDNERRSYAWVSSAGRQVGGEVQVYASNTNENDYTNLWTDRFFGFKYLVGTMDNTESPIRIKPINIYYHMYSGEKLPSLTALIGNLKYVRGIAIAPVTTSRYAAIVDGFFNAEIVRTGPHRWRILKRDGLGTIRFDTTSRQVDFARSSGVVGQRQYQNSLYVTLDPADFEPVIALKDAGPLPGPAYLIESRWEISKLNRLADGFTFETTGFGPGEMSWSVPHDGKYAVEASSPDGASWSGEARAGADRVLRVTVPLDGLRNVRVRIRYRG